ncbi:2-oxoglutarate carboxylase small subunit [Clostridium ragsdalei P11]|uniref:biotin carboxylase n=1 Tax=Clostridium ragsdalei P11 TaxID=1353534 RepID=A0A1A6AUE1_9CLOT|nr:cytidylate kinase family protein [Clostridium ragsdalei]OBR93658.1 2-oxoglutarate carboxylase small subunit [Clostridium ragsdalei P11]
MIKKILIANRGEIVNRIIHTCNKLKIETVVVYSDADKNADYINKAAESYNIGPSAPVKSYLNIDALVDVIKKSGADAVHPGYGFLSEAASFANAVANEGAKWIGPDPSILENIESKCYCRIIANKLGVPVTPGTIKPISSVKEIYDTAQKVGLPILLKLDKGGGGKGIEKITYFESEKVTQAIFESMQRIGNMAFASGDIYIEKAVLSPRHIEVQFIADDYGNVVCLGERECSIQRRYQKIIEESPSAVVTEEDRKKLCSYTQKIIKEMKYSGAGTIEYLRGADGNYYFMEINARLQVEHPVSEYVTNMDLVENQIRIANGEKLPFNQEDIKLKGHSIECRIYAEDPKTFKPSPGTITSLSFPDTSDGTVRIEHAIHEGYKISPFYDPMLCKLVVWGKDRNTCIANMIKALKNFKLEGVSTTINTDIAIMRNKNFVSGNFTTAFLENEKVNIGLENYVITISRQFGSLGRPIAKKMAELLGVEYYDRDIVEEAAKKMNLPVSTIDSGEEIDKNEYKKMKFPLGTSSEKIQEQIFEAQKKIICDLADKSSCIFVGRCSDYILRNHSNHFSIFIYAPYEIRKENCINILHIKPDEADRLIKEVDEARQLYSLSYAKSYSDNVLYKDILINSSLFGGVDETAKVLVNMIRKKFNLA